MIGYEGHRRFVHKSPLASALPAMGQVSLCAKREKHTLKGNRASLDLIQQLRIRPCPDTVVMTTEQRGCSAHTQLLLQPLVPPPPLTTVIAASTP